MSRGALYAAVEVGRHLRPRPLCIATAMLVLSALVSTNTQQRQKEEARTCGIASLLHASWCAIRGQALNGSLGLAMRLHF